MVCRLADPMLSRAVSTPPLPYSGGAPRVSSGFMPRWPPPLPPLPYPLTDPQGPWWRPTRRFRHQFGPLHGAADSETA